VPALLTITLTSLSLFIPFAHAQKTPALKIPDNVIFEADLEYTNPEETHLQLDLARPKSGAGPFPAVLCIHGGGFRAGSRKGYDGLCLKLAQEGYVAATA